MRFPRPGSVAMVAGLLLLHAGLALGQALDDPVFDNQNKPTDEQPTTATRRPTPTPDSEGLRQLPPVVQAGPIDARSYILGPGDVLSVDVWGRFSRNILLPVSPDGTLFLPGGGPLSVSGKSLAWARERVLDLVARTFRGVNAEVRLVQLRSFKVFITGFVRQPGAIVATSATRASEVINGVGLEAGGSRRNIQITRLDGTQLRVDLDFFERLGRQDLDPTLVDGDVIRVPRAVRFVGIAGAVERPGRYELAPDDSLGTLLRLGGGVLPSAAPDHSTMVRFSSPSTRESTTVDLESVARREFDQRIQDGDQLFVHFRSDYHLLPMVEIYGEIERPGTYPIVQGRDRFGDLIRRAGGFRPLANRSGIHLLRQTETAAEQDPEFERLLRLSRSEMTESEYVKFQTKLAERKNSFRIDWTRLQDEPVDVDPLLQSGDVVRVEQLVPTVRVEGEVRRPGLVDFVAGRSLREYVELSGGYTDRAARSDVRVSRSLTGQVIPARSLASIQPGDFIWIPERRDVDAWAVFRDAIAVVGQVAVVVFTLSR